MLTGVTVSSTSIWNWVQAAGELAMQEIQTRIDALSEGQIPECRLEGFLKTLLAIGADGVMGPPIWRLPSFQNGLVTGRLVSLLGCKKRLIVQANFAKSSCLPANGICFR